MTISGLTKRKGRKQHWHSFWRTKSGKRKDKKTEKKHHALRNFDTTTSN